ncbi:MAG: 6,7-dimethyl-8-ribityllumazine synthase [Rickettsiella sp.]|nr:6,7-dimethyl-8-ribityllumazine synthase [Rickettsiella sp.]
MKIIKEISPKPVCFTELKEEFNLAIVVSQFNNKITDMLLKSALERLEALNFPEERITVVKVPGAIEIGLTAQQLAISEANYFAIICLGAVIRGETDHYDYVCQQVSYACQKVALEVSIPVIFGVLTTDDEAQASARIINGADAVDTAIAMVSILDQIENFQEV